MTDRHVDDVLADLKSALDVHPSPSFAAGVRERIEKPRGWFFWSWQTLGATAALGAAAVIASMVYTRPAPAVQQSAPVAPTAAMTPAIPPTPGVAAESASRSAAPAVVRPVKRNVTAAARLDPMAVVTDQQEILQRLWANAGAGNVTQQEFGRALQVAASTEIVPIEVREIVVLPISGLDGSGPLPVGVMPTIKRILDSDSGRSLR